MTDNVKELKPGEKDGLNHPLTPEIAQNALAFLDRVTLQPREIQAFMGVQEALYQIVKR